MMDERAELERRVAERLREFYEREWVNPPPSGTVSAWLAVAREVLAMCERVGVRAYCDAVHHSAVRMPEMMMEDQDAVMAKCEIDLSAAIEEEPPGEPAATEGGAETYGTSPGKGNVSRADSPSASAPDLFPCPFCGGEARFADDGALDSCTVICTQCAVSVPWAPLYAKEYPIAAWNRREGELRAARAVRDAGMAKLWEAVNQCREWSEDKSLDIGLREMNRNAITVYMRAATQLRLLDLAAIVRGAEEKRDA